MEIESVEQSHENETLSSSESNNTDLSLDSSNQELAAAIAELDKMEKFKFQGQEWTPKDLEKAILRQRDYTKKTQSLSEEKKSFEGERKFYENLYADLAFVKENPNTASKFLEIYPEKFHAYLKQVLGGQPQSQSKQQGPQIDVDTLSRLQKIESSLNEQEVAKNTVIIDRQIESMTKKYPNAPMEMALAKVYDWHSQGMKIDQSHWEKAFKQVDQQMDQLFKTRYKDLIKKQTEANKKARDVDSGGGTPGRAPAKFSKFKDVTEHAVRDLTSKA